MTRFKKRNGIHLLTACGELQSADTGAAKEFCEWFPSFLLENHVARENLYNADETGFKWRCLPRATMATKDEKRVDGLKEQKERLTVMVCANGTGSLKIPLLVIGVAKMPRACRGKVLPVTYTNQKGAWMSQKIFVEWYDDIFIPTVKAHQKANGFSGNVVLLLDNAPTHPKQETLVRENGRFRVQYLPPNVTALIQPMDQAVIATLKKRYRKTILEKHLINFEGGVKEFLKQFNIKDAMDVMASSWDEIQSKTIHGSFNHILEQYEEPQVVTEVEVVELIGEQSLETLDWFNDNHDDPFEKPFNSSEAIELLIEYANGDIVEVNGNVVEVIHDLDRIEELGPEEECVADADLSPVSNVEFLKALDICDRYVIAQEDAYMNDINWIKKWKGLADKNEKDRIAKKVFTQANINHYFATK